MEVEEKSCDNCTKESYCPAKGEVCEEHNPKNNGSTESDPLAGLDIPTVNANWTDNCGAPC